MVLTKEDLEREHKEHKEYLRGQAVENELEEMANRDPTMTGLAVLGITALIIVGGAILGKYLGEYIEKRAYERNVSQEIYQRASDLIQKTKITENTYSD